jgi:hypothetical protein
VWRHIAESLQGPSHVADGTSCQDRNRVCVFRDHSACTLVACVADGAGSAKFADVGSTIACEAIIKNAAAYFHAHGAFDGLDRDEALHWCDDARAQIQAAAAERNCDCRELATTLSVAIVAPEASKFFQIGDGAIILRSHGVYGVVFWPQSGEYANSTNFLTADDYREQLAFLAAPNGCSEVALLTDGLERLALRFDHQTPHAPFFDPLFSALRSAKDVAGLSEGLRQFLGSESVQLRSDDDKTLILASRHNSNDPA